MGVPLSIFLGDGSVMYLEVLRIFTNQCVCEEPLPVVCSADCRDGLEPRQGPEVSCGQVTTWIVNRKETESVSQIEEAHLVFGDGDF